MSLWEERAARNEALFREVNEQVNALASDSHGSAEFLCECGNADCTERVHVPLRLYEQIRTNPRAFLLVPGHENDEFETAVERGVGYLVVEKEGTAGRIAERTDPRNQ